MRDGLWRARPGNFSGGTPSARRSGKVSSQAEGAQIREGRPVSVAQAACGAATARPRTICENCAACIESLISLGTASFVSPCFLLLPSVHASPSHLHNLIRAHVRGVLSLAQNVFTCREKKMIYRRWLDYDEMNRKHNHAHSLRVSHTHKHTHKRTPISWPLRHVIHLNRCATCHVDVRKKKSLRNFGKLEIEN